MNKYQKYIDDPNYEFVTYNNKTNNFAFGGKQQETNIGKVPPNQANSEVENNEVAQFPNGTTTNFVGNNHSEGGIKTNLPSGTNIFSARIKYPGTNKTIADIAKKYPTTKYQKKLEDTNSDSITKTTAELMINRNNQMLQGLFQDQEMLKQNKMQTSLMKAQKKYEFGGMTPPNRLTNKTLTKPQMFNKGGMPCYNCGGMKYSLGGDTAVGAGEGALSGAATGMAFGPWGALIGGIGGGLMGAYNGYNGSKQQEELLKQQQLQAQQMPIQPQQQGIFASGGNVGYEALDSFKTARNNFIKMDDMSRPYYTGRLTYELLDKADRQLPYANGGTVENFSKGGRFMGINPAQQLQDYSIGNQYDVDDSELERLTNLGYKFKIH